MLSNPLRAVLFAGALSLFAVIGGPIASASAEVESSRITAPASPTYALYDETLPPHQHAFTVSGTTSGAGDIALRCYYGVGPKEYRAIAKEVTPIANAFSVEVETEALYDGPCVLRAVPVKNEEAHPPGTAAEEAQDPFQGPVIVGSTFEVFANDKLNYDYELEADSLTGSLGIESAGDCGLVDSFLFSPGALTASSDLYDCNATFFNEDRPPSGNATRSDLQIDGANAYTPAMVHYLEEQLKPTTTLPGTPQITVTQSFDEKTGLATIHEVDPIVKCAPEAVFPPTTTSCTEFVSTGVQLERNWQTGNADRTASMTDTWSATDGKAHSLDALYEQWLVTEGKEGGAFEFPGSSTFSATTDGEAIALPTGAGTVSYKEDAATPAAGDGKHTSGAIVYDRTPSGPLTVHQGSHETGGDDTQFAMPYQAMIPAAGTYTLRMGFVQAYALSEAQTLAAAITSSFAPTLAIATPSSGTTVSSPSVTVSGTAADTGALSSLTVAGHEVSVGAGGAWSTSVALSQGANTITAVATDQAGISTSRSVSVTYTPPRPPVAHASQVGTTVVFTNGKVNRVRFTLACTGSPGTSCEIQTSLTTIEKTRHGRPIAVSARRGHPLTHSQRVLVGSSELTIPAGQRVTLALALNATGKRLLARFGYLPVHLEVNLVSAGHRSTIIAQNLALRPHSHSRPHSHRPHKQRHRH